MNKLLFNKQFSIAVPEIPVVRTNISYQEFLDRTMGGELHVAPGDQNSPVCATLKLTNQVKVVPDSRYSNQLAYGDIGFEYVSESQIVTVTYGLLPLMCYIVTWVDRTGKYVSRPLYNILCAKAFHDKLLADNVAKMLPVVYELENISLLDTTRFEAERSTVIPVKIQLGVTAVVEVNSVTRAVTGLADIKKVVAKEKLDKKLG